MSKEQYQAKLKKLGELSKKRDQLISYISALAKKIVEGEKAPTYHGQVDLFGELRSA